MDKTQWAMKSKIGPLYLVASEAGLHGLFWNKQDVPMARSLKGGEPASRILATAVEQVEQYLDGEREDFDLPLAATGTEFQKRVWSELRKIPYGETRSYGDIARKVNNRRAVRAVGAANGRNPIAIIVPCHRVIGADGSLTGFGGGLDIKTRLLALERRGKET
jgi:methylated-DNA-[protein]-cysteine S-methyltransferase